MIDIKPLYSQGAWKLEDEGDGIARLVFDLPGEKVNKLTSGRGSLIYNGLRIAKRNPEIGVGVGGFSRAYSNLTHRHPRQSASHDTPVTVAAAQSVVLSLRLDSETVKRLDRVRSEHAKLFEDYPALIQWQHTFSRAVVLREAIRLGLDVIEEKTRHNG